MMIRIFSCVVIVLLCALFSSCSGKREVDSNRELEIVYKGSHKKLDENAVELCDQIEAMVEDVCNSGSFLTTLLPTSEVDSYKKNGLCIDLSYKGVKSFTLKGHSEPVKITGIYILMGEEMDNYIVYGPLDNVSKVYILPTKYCDEIVSFLTIDFDVH